GPTAPRDSPDAPGVVRDRAARACSGVSTAAPPGSSTGIAHSRVSAHLLAANGPALQRDQTGGDPVPADLVRESGAAPGPQRHAASRMESFAGRDLRVAPHPDHRIGGAILRSLLPGLIDRCRDLVPGHHPLATGWIRVQLLA